MTDRQTMDDMALLREYAVRDSETAFETLVSRRVGFVYSAALRQVRDPRLAEEITQTVFIILAQKAARISEKTIIGGWLFKTTRFVAIAEMRKLAQRRQYEQEADMESEIESTAPDPVWEQMSPLIDGALAALGEKDRHAVLLRFFENKSLAEVGRCLATNEDTAGKRVSRALEKLRKHFSRNGVTSTPSVIAGMISTHSVHAAPVALAKTVSAVALAKGALAAGSTSTLLTGTFKLMAWTKTTTTAVVIGVILAGGATALIIQHQHRPAIPVPVQQKAGASMNFSTPQDAFQSWLAAMGKGDLQATLASFTPEGQVSFMQTAGKGKSESDLVAMNTKIAQMMGNTQVASNQVVSADQSILHLRSDRLGNVSVPMKKIGNEWKINGNITAGEAAK
jgi:RNA polymerase sigma factor (sigma-70 family)